MRRNSGREKKGKGEEKMAEIRKELRSAERRQTEEKKSTLRRKVDVGPHRHIRSALYYELSPQTLTLCFLGGETE